MLKFKPKSCLKEGPEWCALALVESVLYGGRARTDPHHTQLLPRHHIMKLYAVMSLYLFAMNTLSYFPCIPGPFI